MKAPDVKAAVMQHLQQAGVSIVSTRPEGADAPTRFVRVIGTGGPGRTKRILQIVQVTVDSYAESTGRAFELANTVDALIHAMPSSGTCVARVHYATTPAEYPDPDTKQARYTATYQLTALLA